MDPIQITNTAQLNLTGPPVYFSYTKEEKNNQILIINVQTHNSNVCN